MAKNSFHERYGPVALVTGASSGIGWAFAEELAERGFDLVLAARRTERLAELAARLDEAHGTGCQLVVSDLARPDAPAALLEATAGQDIGLVVNPKTAESQIYGACIMSICGALMEERVIDGTTGRVLNPDLEWYKLAGIKDIGEIIAHIEIDEQNDKRGIIGLGEPPAVGGIAAIANAVANAIGLRVPYVPLTPDRVINALHPSGRQS